MNNSGHWYGLIAQFPTPMALLQAARAARAEGYVRFDAYSPMPIKGLAEAVGFGSDRISSLALVGGIIGCAGTFALQWYSVSAAYPLNVGGRTPFWPGLVPATFEMTILGAALAIFFGMLFANGLPQLYHPVFNLPEFGLASRDGFFLCIQAVDPQFDVQETRQFLERLGPLKVTDVAEAETR